jgi:hypothetical protein
MQLPIVDLRSYKASSASSLTLRRRHLVGQRLRGRSMFGPAKKRSPRCWRCMLATGRCSRLATRTKSPNTAHGGDFEEAEQLIESWELGTQEEWRAKSAELMARPENVSAVRRLADQLVQDRRIDGQLINLFVAVADGDITEERLSLILAALTKVNC